MIRRKTHKRFLMMGLLALFGFSSVNAIDYYVSSTGNDANAGTSAGAAWASIAKVNSVTFGPGDSILFEGGKTFQGKLQLDQDMVSFFPDRTIANLQKIYVIDEANRLSGFVRRNRLRGLLLSFLCRGFRGFFLGCL